MACRTTAALARQDMRRASLKERKSVEILMTAMVLPVELLEPVPIVSALLCVSVVLGMRMKMEATPAVRAFPKLASCQSSITLRWKQHSLLTSNRLSRSSA